MNERAEEFLRKLGLTPEIIEKVFPDFTNQLSDALGPSVYRGMDQAKPGGEHTATIIGCDVLPEQCPWCSEEFIYDSQSGEPPTMLTECSCGQWRMVFVG